jgi:hypothetical protein
MLVGLLRLSIFCRPLMLLLFIFPLFITLRGLTTLTGFLPVIFLLVLFFTRATLALLLILILSGGLALPLLGLA